MARTVAMGAQDFGDIIRNNYFYVDKTAFIKEWWENGDIVTLITRPRRFGKTLTMNMADYFFSVQHRDDRSLFEGLSIWKEEKYRRLQGTYPVICLSFANVKADNYIEARKSICILIEELYQHYRFLLKNNFLSDKEILSFHRISSEMDDADAKYSLNRLSNYLSRYYGKKVIILLDEYDTPMQEAYVNGYWNEMSSFTRGLFHTTFKTNSYLGRAIMTGITRVGKESIFSDLNNLKVITVFSGQYADSFGFTEQEVEAGLEEFGLMEQKMLVRNWYDGFRFGETDHIYNPWSVTSYLDEKKLKPYWANTSSNRLISDLIRKGSADIKETMERLLQGRTAEFMIEEETVFDQLDRNKNAVWSLLSASGYLKVISIETDRNWRNHYKLAITNFEVLLMFQQMILGWFGSYAYKLNNFCDALLKGNAAEMRKCLEDDTLYMFSYFDTLTENSYHMFVLGLIACLRTEYVITSNSESGYGRYDTMLEPIGCSRDGIILEYKKFNEKTDETLQETVQKALCQIVEKKYAASLEKRGIPKERIRIYGLAFDGKKVLVDGGYLHEFD